MHGTWERDRIFFIEGREGKSDAYCHTCEKYEKVTNARCDFFHSAMIFKRKARFIGGSFGPLVIVRLFHRRFFHGPTMVNCRRVPLDMTDSKRKRK